MRQAVPLERFFPDLDGLTRPELIRGYQVVERHRERVSTGRRSWVEKIPQADGTVLVRVFEQGRLMEKRTEMPAGSAHARTSRGVYGARLG